MGRQTSELLFLTSTTMKAFIVLSLAATALAVPARGGRRQGGKNAQKKERIDPGNILRCTAENFGNNQTIKDCIDCFSTEMDFSSQTGLDAAKGKGKGKAMKKMIMNTLMQAHCEHASNGDATKNAACEQCFKDAMPSKPLTGKGGRGGRGGRRRGKRAAKEKDPAILAAI